MQMNKIKIFITAAVAAAVMAIPLGCTTENSVALAGDTHTYQLYLPDYWISPYKFQAYKVGEMNGSEVGSLSNDAVVGTVYTGEQNKVIVCSNGTVEVYDNTSLLYHIASGQWYIQRID